jgi:ATP-dependent Zn protease
MITVLGRELTDESTVRRVLIATHESGHAVSARFLDLGVASVTIVPDADAAGRTRYAVPERDYSAGMTNEIALEIMRHTISSLAGPEAELRQIASVVAVTPGMRHSMRLTAWRSDVQMVRQGTALLAPNRPAAFYLWAVRQARRLLDQVWPSVERVAEALLDRLTITAAEIDELLRDTSSTNS